MDGQWGEPYETTAAEDGLSWLPASLWNQPMPPCARCGSAFDAHTEGKCPAPMSAPSRAHWPRRHPWLSGAILLVALLGGVGVGTVSVSHSVNWNTPNGQACEAYWQFNNRFYAFQFPTSTDSLRHLQAVAPDITDQALGISVRAFEEELGYADLPDAQNTAVTIAAVCNALGYGNLGS
jgi:hypothetical protein